jgi:hypothetical protein
MAEAAKEEIIPLKETDKSSKALKDIIFGICLFVGINLILLLIWKILGGFFWRIDSRFFDNSNVYIEFLGNISFPALVFINLILFVYILIKRPLMAIGMLAGIPVLFLLIFFIWCALAIILFLLWILLLLLHGIGLV